MIMFNKLVMDFHNRTNKLMTKSKKMQATINADKLLKLNIPILCENIMKIFKLVRDIVLFINKIIQHKDFKEIKYITSIKTFVKDIKRILKFFDVIIGYLTDRRLQKYLDTTYTRHINDNIQMIITYVDMIKNIDNSIEETLQDYNTNKNTEDYMSALTYIQESFQTSLKDTQEEEKKRLKPCKK